MEITTTKMITKEIKEILQTKCDFCDARTDQFPSDEAQRKCFLENFNIDYHGSGYSWEVDVELRISNSYGGDGGDSLRITLDCCTDCFKKKIMDQALRYDREEIDW
jgi:hypothetical protein